MILRVAHTLQVSLRRHLALFLRQTSPIDSHLIQSLCSVQLHAATDGLFFRDLAMTVAFLRFSLLGQGSRDHSVYAALWLIFTYSACTPS